MVIYFVLAVWMFLYGGYGLIKFFGVKFVPTIIGIIALFLFAGAALGTT